MKKLIALLLALLLTFSMAGAFAEEAESENPLRIVWYQGNGIDTLFQNPQWDMSLMLASNMLYESVARYDKALGAYVPTIAEEFGHNEEFTEFWVTIKDGVTWHDGEPVTVEDLFFSIHAYILNPATSAGGAWKEVIGYEAAKNGETETIEGVTIEDGKLVVRLATSQWSFSGHLSCVLLPEHCFEGVAWADFDTSDYFKKPIGCGAYQIDEVAFPDYFTLVPYEGYYDGVAGIKKVEVVNLSGEATVAALMAGDIDYANRTTVTSKDVCDSVVAMNPDVTIIEEAGFSTRAFFFNLGDRADKKVKADLQKKEVRQAFDILMDETQIAAVYQGMPTGTLVNPQSLEYNADCARAYDVAAAKALLDAAGFDYSQVYDFAYYYDEQATHDCFALITQLFAAAGVQVNPILLSGDLADLIYTSKNYDLLMLMTTASQDLPANCHGQLMSSTSYTFMGVHEERGAIYDPMVTEYRANPVLEERIELAKNMQAQAFEDCYALSGYMYTNYQAYNSAKVSIPEGALTGVGGYQWADWAMIG